MEVSQLFYKFARGLIVNYYYNVSNFSSSIYGASLQRPRFVPGTTLISGFVFVRLDVLLYNVNVYGFLDLLYWVFVGM